MKVIKNYLAIYFSCMAFLFSACGGNKNAEESAAGIEATQTSADTFSVSGKCMVFFQPSDVEYNEMVNKDVDGGIYEVRSDFGYYSQVMMDTLQSSDVKPYMTICKVINVTLDNGDHVFISLNNGNSVVGTVLSDGVQTPKVEFGVSTDLDYWMMSNEFFHKDGTQ
jgi:hypothetical protein